MRVLTIGILGGEGDDHHHAQQQAEQLVGEVQHLVHRALGAGDKEVQAHQAAVPVQGDQTDKGHPQEEDAAQLHVPAKGLAQEVTAEQLHHDDQHQGRNGEHADHFRALGHPFGDPCYTISYDFSPLQRTAGIGGAYAAVSAILFGSAHLRQDGVQQLLVVPALILILIIVGVAAQRVLEGLDIRLEVDSTPASCRVLVAVSLSAAMVSKLYLAAALACSFRISCTAGSRPFQVLALAAGGSPPTCS